MIIHINGAINSGKTTVGIELAKLIPNSKFIDADYLVPDDDSVALEVKIELIINEIIKKAKELVKAGYVGIFSYPLSDEQYQKISSNIEGDYLVFSLNPPIDTCLSNRGERVLNEWELNRIRHHYLVGINAPKFSYRIIDNSNQKPIETAAKIFSIVKGYLKCC